MSRPVLYSLKGSPPASAVRMLAKIIGLDLDVKNIDPIALEHKTPEYIKRNPMGTVPTLQDGDFNISESHSIMKYLLFKYGADKSEALYPSDLRTRALVDQCMFFDTGVYFIRLKVVSLPTLFHGLDGPSTKNRQDIEEAYGMVEAYLGDRKYIAADHLTLADLSSGATTAAMQCIHKLDPSKFPRTVKWLSRLEQEDFFQEIMIPSAQILGQVLSIYWEKNKTDKL